MVMAASCVEANKDSILTLSSMSAEDKINQLKQLIREIEPNELQNSLYACVSNTCTLLTSFFQMKGAPGWSSRLVDSSGLPLLSSEDQSKIESAFSSAPWILDYLQSFLKESSSQNQSGGSLDIPQLSSKSAFVESISDISSLTGEDVSLDSAFQKFLEKTSKLDSYWNSFAQTSPVSKVLDRDILLTIP